MPLFHKTFGDYGPSLMLLHGWGFNSAVWCKLVSPLVSHYKVTVVDLPGFGKSEFTPECEDITFQASLVSELIEEPTHILGWSLGGLIAMHIAYLFPEKIKSFVGVCTSPKFLASETWPGIASCVLENFAKDLKGNYEKTLSRFLLLQWPNPENERQEIQGIKTAIFQQGNPSQEALTTGLDLLRTVDFREKLSSLVMPTSLILGNLDALVPRSVSPLITELNPGCNTTVIPHAAHAPFLSHPDIFLQLLKEHMTKTYDA